MWLLLVLKSFKKFNILLKYGYLHILFNSRKESISLYPFLDSVPFAPLNLCQMYKTFQHVHLRIPQGRTVYSRVTQIVYSYLSFFLLVC